MIKTDVQCRNCGTLWTVEWKNKNRKRGVRFMIIGGCEMCGQPGMRILLKIAKRRWGLTARKVSLEVQNDTN